MDDTFEYNCTTEAFQILGFSDEERDGSYKITMGVMMMGDMVYKQKPRDEQAESNLPESLTNSPTCSVSSPTKFAQLSQDQRSRSELKW